MVAETPFGRVTEVKLLLEQALGVVEEFGDDRIMKSVHQDVMAAYRRVRASQIEIRRRDVPPTTWAE